MNKEYFYNRVDQLLLEASETNEFLKVLDQVYQKKRGENYPERTKDDTFYRQELLDIAKSVGFQPQSTDLILASNSAKQYMLKPENLNKIQRDPPTTSAPPQVVEDVPKKKWPSYNEFRKKWYKKTVELGWPKNLKSPYADSQEGDGIVYPWGPFNTAYVFNKRGSVNSFVNYTKQIKNYLYTKFERDTNGLKALYDKVSSIVELEKQFLKKKSSNFMASVALSIFKGLGASASDEAFLKWASKKFTGMTIFEYQEMILDEMYAKMSITGTTSDALKKLITSLYNAVKKTEGFSSLYSLDQIKTEYSREDKEFVATFDIKTRTGSRELENYSAYVFILDTLVRNLIQKKYNSTSRRDLTSNLDETELNTLIAAIENSTHNEEDRLKIINNKIPVFTMEDIQGRNAEVVGTYKITIGYIVKGCQVKISYKPEEQ